MINRLDIDSPDFEARLTRLLAYTPEADAAIEQAVAGILADVRLRGDLAVLDYAKRFDRTDVPNAAALRLAPAEIKAAWDSVEPAVQAALQTAVERIRRYHEHQRAPSWMVTEADGTRLGQRVLPLDRVGIYVPGGKAAYPSTVLMNAIPARVAGVAEIAMVVPTPDGVRNPIVLAAAHLAGVDEIYTIGGAHAVAALAYGTATIRPVDKIVGPGNAYVAEAKRRVFGTVGIDMIAGPSEILVVGDGSVPADWVAMDLFSQAEHDEMAQAILISTDAAWLDAVAASLARQLPEMPRRAVIARSLADRGALIRVNSLDEAVALVNRVAPEHLELAVAEPDRLAEGIRHAGAIFLGAQASESLGDYCAGPSHVLPTMRTPRFSSPLGVYDFQKRSSLIAPSAAGARTLGPIAARLARGEGLEAHARSAEYRLDTAAATAPGAAEASGTATASLAVGASPGAAGVGTDPRIEQLVRADVRAMAGYHVADASGLVKLDAMENPWPLPEALQRAFADHLAGVALNRYPVPTYARLKGAIRRTFEVPAAVDLVLGNGSDELIAMLSTLLARPGASVLAPVPSFVMYSMSARLAGLDYVGVPLGPDFALDRAAMLTAIERHQPALVWLAWPNNPTGNCFAAADVEAILAAAPGLVVLDEAYEPFAEGSWLPRMADFPNLLVLRTLSKWGLAGVRLGLLAAPPAWCAELEKVRPPYNVGVLNDAAALFALDHADTFAAQAAAVRADRARLVERLEALRVESIGAQGLTRIFASRANFVLVRVAAAASAGRGSRLAARMRADGVLIKDVGRMDTSLADCLRLTVGTPDENAKMLDALAAALAAEPI